MVSLHDYISYQRRIILKGRVSLGGHVRPEVYFSMPNYIKKYGFKMAVEISNFEMSHLQVLKDIVEKERIDCEFTLTRSMDVFLEEEPALQCKKAYDLMCQSGVSTMKDVQFTPSQYAEGVRVHAASIQPLSFNPQSIRSRASKEPKGALVSQPLISGRTNSSCTSSQSSFIAAPIYRRQHPSYPSHTRSIMRETGQS